MYTITRKCFKWYTQRQKLKAIKLAEAVAQDIDDEMEEIESIKPMLWCSSVTQQVVIETPNSLN